MIKTGTYFGIKVLKFYVVGAHMHLMNTAITAYILLILPFQHLLFVIIEYWNTFHSKEYESDTIITQNYLLELYKSSSYQCTYVPVPVSYTHLDVYKRQLYNHGA